MAGCNLAKVNFLKKNIQILKFRKFEYYQMCLYMHCFFITYFSFDNNFNIISNTRGQLSNPHSQVKIIFSLARYAEFLIFKLALYPICKKKRHVLFHKICISTNSIPGLRNSTVYEKYFCIL